MCSSGQPLCSGRQRSRSPRRSEGGSLGSQYAFCALGVGLVALGVVMILWSLVPLETPRNSSTSNSNSTSSESKLKTSSVAFVLVGAGLAMLLLAVCLSVRSKKRRSQSRGDTTNATQYTDRVQGGPDENEQPAPSYDVPSYEEAVTSGQYPVRQSNLRQSTSQLPSYEDLISAVENEGEGQNSGSGQNTPAARTQPANPQPSRSGSRASRLLRPLRVRRIMSEKLHVKDIRLNIQTPPQGKVTIEPLTPPPQYEDKPPEFPTDGV